MHCDKALMPESEADNECTMRMVARAVDSAASNSGDQAGTCMEDSVVDSIENGMG